MRPVCIIVPAASKKHYQKGDHMKLIDTWEKTGSDLKGFCQEISELTAHTEYKKFSTAEFALLAYGYETPSSYRMRMIDALALSDFETTGEAIIEFPIEKEKSDKDLMEETVRNAGFMISDGKYSYYISKYAMVSIFARANLNGDGMARRSLSKCLFLEESLHYAGIGENGRNHRIKERDNPNDYNCTMVIRKQGNSRKLFFLPTEKYAPMPLTVLSDTAKYIMKTRMFGVPKVKKWSVSHAVSEVQVVFPEMKEEIKEKYNLDHDILPGILIRSSDIGMSCTEMQVIAYIGNSKRYVVLNGIKQKHAGEFNVDEMLEEAEKMIRNVVADLPSRMLGLKKVEIIGKKMSKSDRKKVAETLFTKSFRQIGLSSVIGKKREMMFKQDVVEKFNGQVSAYDVAICTLTIGDYFNDSVVENDIATRCGGIVDYLADMR
jgi:hypothetical protein